MNLYVYIKFTYTYGLFLYTYFEVHTPTFLLMHNPNCCRAWFRTCVFEGHVNAQEAMSRLEARHGCGSGRQPWVLGGEEGRRV